MPATWVADGATLIDIGGESTRPGAPDVSEQEELDRVIPVVERMVAELDVMISLDTSKAIVMREGCAAGGHLINDVRALQEPGRWARRPRLAYRYASCTCRAAPYHAGGAALWTICWGGESLL